MFIHNRKVRFLVLIALAAILAASLYAFAAANTVPASKAGDGSGAITGYTVSTIHYVLNGTNPGTIDAVTFTLDAIPSGGNTIMIRLVNPGGAWYTCTNVGTAVTCNNGSTLGAAVTPANSLEVVIAD